jgi:hypothetical protein
MVYSRLERYPTEYSSTDYLDWLAKLQDEELKDEVEEEGSDNEDYGLITGTEKQNLKLYQSLELGSIKPFEFEKHNIPRPPNKRAELSLSFIGSEFDKIKKRAEKFLHDGQKDKDIVQFANQNIQKAKKIAIDSGHLSKHSFNAGLLRAAAKAAPEGVTLAIESIKGIPLYNGGGRDGRYSTSREGSEGTYRCRRRFIDGYT